MEYAIIFIVVVIVIFIIKGHYSKMLDDEKNKNENRIQEIIQQQNLREKQIHGKLRGINKIEKYKCLIRLLNIKEENEA